jgi:anthranilate phosphoribosyltransferase
MSLLSPQQVLERIIDHREIFHDDMVNIMRQIMQGELSPTLTASILIGLQIRKETIGEISAAASVMREFANKVEVQDRNHMVDVVGTGGDTSHTFNISTTAMFVTAASGAIVAKHGNRSVSSKSGSADLLESLGVKIDLQPQAVSKCLEQMNMGFMFAPNHHPAMKNVVPIRKELGVRTIFNILGPLTNPADAPNILMGVFHPDLVGIQARVLQQLGAERAMVVWGRDGLDEISLGASTFVAELKGGNITEYEIHPEDFGLSMSSTRQLAVKTPDESKQVCTDVLNGLRGPARNIVCLNAGATLYVSGIADSISDGIAKASAAIDHGHAKAKLEQYIKLTNSL